MQQKLKNKKRKLTWFIRIERLFNYALSNDIIDTLEIIKSNIEYEKHFNGNVGNNNIAASFNSGISRKITGKLYRGRGIVRGVRFANGLKFGVNAALVLGELSFLILFKVLTTHRGLKRLNVMLFTVRKAVVGNKSKIYKFKLFRGVEHTLAQFQNALFQRKGALSVFANLFFRAIIYTFP
ncbi:hypothetical protein GGTG_07391 [Gaeumannomyces tritici R3-111a-1]|uniref:Uncharacterized protein n=1 Tax=Gaeumannomyces tritici (strain R3-111a-1) TaxID=644352 RepID=J3P1J3_GAET3|nr:hypothetical protein GGTG_07391 [Gaeumannomyces tritici R3-111a-1]EJT73535.1 hypothetical protein GGTG_07391 [Gaeumannomyces tritici R3-111a-1]